MIADMKSICWYLLPLVLAFPVFGKGGREYLNLLSPADRSLVKELFKDISQVDEGLIPISGGKGSPILILHGIDYSDFPEEWVIPFSELILGNRLSYLHKWSNRKGLIENRELLLKSLSQLFKMFPNEKITVFGYSAGGAISLMALDKLSDSPEMDRIFLHTIASPFFGFEAPAKHAYVMGLIMGKGRFEMGIGAYTFMNNKRFGNCHHWVTTNCSLDKNSCPQEKLNPQTGPFDGSVEMPCGNENVTKFNNETHTSVIMPVLKQIQ